MCFLDLVSILSYLISNFLVTSRVSGHKYFNSQNFSLNFEFNWAFQFSLYNKNIYIVLLFNKVLKNYNRGAFQIVLKNNCVLSLRSVYAGRD